MKFGSVLADVALSQVGVKEVGGNNKGLQIIEYQKTTWLKPGPWPWCAAFVGWCVNESLKNVDVSTELKLKTLKSKNLWRPRTASAYDYENWAKSHGFTILSEQMPAMKGDIVTFDFSHIGIVVENQINDYITTVEGNTNQKGERDSLSGDGVWKKTRHKSLIRYLLRKI